MLYQIIDALPEGRLQNLERVLQYEELPQARSAVAPEKWLSVSGIREALNTFSTTLTKRASRAIEDYDAVLKVEPTEFMRKLRQLKPVFKPKRKSGADDRHSDRDAKSKGFDRACRRTAAVFGSPKVTCNAVLFAGIRFLLTFAHQ